MLVYSYCKFATIENSLPKSWLSIFLNLCKRFSSSYSLERSSINCQFLLCFLGSFHTSLPSFFYIWLALAIYKKKGVSLLATLAPCFSFSSTTFATTGLEQSESKEVKAYKNSFFYILKKKKQGELELKTPFFALAKRKHHSFFL